MKRSKFAEEQILFALKQADAGQPVGDVCRQMSVSETTFYVLKKRHGNLLSAVSIISLSNTGMPCIDLAARSRSPC